MEDGSSPFRGLVVFLLFVIFNGIFYGFSAAIQNLSEQEVERKEGEGNKKAKKLRQLMRNPSSLIQVITTITTLLGICFGTFGIRGLTRYFHLYIGSGAAFVLVILLSVILLMSLGVFSFKKIGACYPEKTAYAFVNVVCFFLAVFAPLTWVISKISNLVVRLFGIDPDRAEADVTEEEIISMVGEAQDQGVIEENEAEMIQNIINFGEMEANDIMTHRKNIVALDVDTTLDGVIDVMLEEGFSRYPVYQEDLDDILGIVHFKDVVKVLTEQEAAGSRTLRSMPGLLRNVAFIPGTRSISSIFQTMQHKKIHMAIVVDEYGQTDGLVTMEDIVEEIVGDIEDEYDEEEVFIKQQHDNSVLIEGLTHLDDVEEELGIEIAEERFETLNGYLTDILGHIPTAEDKEVIANGYRFQILSVSGNVIAQVRVEKLHPQKTEIMKGEDKTCQDIQNLRI